MQEEEDEYDKVASGRESAGERLYMKNVINQGNRTVLAKSFHGTRDPRANHMAAKIRLTEDEAEAQKFSQYGCDRKVRELHRKPYNESGSQLRSILKRKDNKSDSKSHKRVRFVDPGCKTESKEEASQKTQAISVGSSSVNHMISRQNRFSVPDHVENPFKCTHYSYNAPSEVEEKAHAGAGMNFLKLVKGQIHRIGIRVRECLS